MPTNNAQDDKAKYLTEADVIRIVNNLLTNYTYTSRFQRGSIQSKNFVTGVSGWIFRADGTRELN